MFATKRFPSVFEASTAELTNVAKDLLTGLKIQIEGTSYIVGELALLEGASPHKRINSSPSDLDYRLLLQAALAVAQARTESPLAVVTGFPYSSYSVCCEPAENLIQGKRVIQFDGRTFGGSANSAVEVEVSEAGVIPEIEGLATALRKGEMQETDPFFAVSLGYGTFEAVLSLPSGTVRRTATSGHGLRLAARRMIDQLRQEHHLGMLTEHQIDRAIREGFLVVGRRRIDLSGLRPKLLQLYYDNVISPALENAFSGRDFNRASKMYIAGGGAHYDSLIDAFASEFGELLNVRVAPSPETCVSRGFALTAEELGSERGKRSVGIDLGNANTAVSLLQEKPLGKRSAYDNAPVSEVETVSGDGSLFAEGNTAPRQGPSSSEEQLFVDTKA